MILIVSHKDGHVVTFHIDFHIIRNAIASRDVYDVVMTLRRDAVVDLGLGEGIIEKKLVVITNLCDGKFSFFIDEKFRTVMITNLDRCIVRSNIRILNIDDIESIIAIDLSPVDLLRLDGY